MNINWIGVASAFVGTGLIMLGIPDDKLSTKEKFLLTIGIILISNSMIINSNQPTTVAAPQN